ncbi:MAG: RNA polymerase sigma-70 factor [Rikenellaceae bacterium]
MQKKLDLMQKVPDDKELMKSIINGNKRSFDIFYSKEYNKVLFFSVQYLHNRTLAEDVVQDSFIALWEKRSFLDMDFPIQPYLYSIVKNRCLNLLRKLANDKKIKNEVLQREYRASIIALTDDSSDAVIKFQLEEYIKKAYKDLPEKVSSTFILNRIHGMTYQEIAESKGISVKVVEYHITQALKLFRSRLRDFLPEENLL